jgi:hypothetical protein
MHENAGLAVLFREGEASAFLQQVLDGDRQLGLGALFDGKEVITNYYAYQGS